MWKIILFLSIALTAVIFSQSGQQEAHLTSYEVRIPANILTKIVMYNSDSTNIFTLFDNIIEQEQKVIFIIQPNYYSEKMNYKDAIVLPFPKIESGMYLINYFNKDTSFVKKMVFLK